MRTTHPNCKPSERLSPKETYTRLEISYSQLKQKTNQGFLRKEWREDGSPFYSGETINRFWESKSKFQGSCSSD